MKSMKVLLAIFSALVLLLITAVIVVPLVVEPNDFKPQIIAAVKEKTGRDLQIAGDIGLTLFPQVGLSLGRVELSNATGFDGEYFARLDGLRVRVALLPLLSKEVKVDTVTLDGLRLLLERAADGRTNWDDLAKVAGQSNASAQTTEGSGTPLALTSLALDGVKATNAAVEWRDAKTQEHIKVLNLGIDTGPLALAEPVQLTLSFDVEHGPTQSSARVSVDSALNIDIEKNIYVLQGLMTKVDLKSKLLPSGQAKVEAQMERGEFDANNARVAFQGFDIQTTGLGHAQYSGDLAVRGNAQGDLATQVFSTDGLTVRGNLADSSVPNDKLGFELAAKVEADLQNGKVVASGISAVIPALRMQGLAGKVNVSATVDAAIESQVVNVSDLKMTGQLTGAALSDNTIDFELASAISARLIEGIVEARELLVSGMASGKQVPSGKQPFRLQSEVIANIASKELALSKLVFSAADLNGQGTLKLTQWDSNPSLIGNVTVDAFNPRTVAKMVGQSLPIMVDGKALTSLALVSDIAATPTQLQFDGLKLRLDGTQITGAIKASQLDKPLPRLELALQIDALDVDRYMPVAGPSSGAAKPVPTKSGGASGLPIDLLRSLAVAAQIRIGRLKVKGARLQDFNARVSADGGRISLSPLSASLYDGSYEGSVVFDVTSDKAQVSANERIKNINVPALLADIGVKLPVDLSGGASTVSLKADASGNVAKQQFNFSELALSTDLSGKDFPGQRLKLDLTADMYVDVLGETVNIKSYALRMLGAVAQGNLAVDKFSSAPAYQGKISLAPFSPRKLMKALGVSAAKTADPEALGEAELSAAIQGTPARVTLDKLIVKLDESTLKGSVEVSDIARMATVFDLNLNRINLDRYLPKPSKRDSKEQDDKSKKSPASPAAEAAPLPVDVVRTLNLSGKVQIASLVLRGLKISEINAELRAKDGLLKVHPLTASLYGGRYNGNINLDAVQKTARINLDERLDGVAVGPLLKDFDGSEFLEGTMNLHAKLSADGKTDKAMRSTLGGRLNFSFLDGALVGFNAVNTLCNGLGTLAGSGGKKGKDLIADLIVAGVQSKTSSGSQLSAGKTKFASLAGSFDIDNGLAVGKDLLLQSPLLRGEGAGSVDLRREKIDYRVNTSLVSSCEGQGGKSRADLRGVTLPILCDGSFSAPNCHPEWKQALASLGGLKGDDTSDKNQGTLSSAKDTLSKAIGKDAVSVLTGSSDGSAPKADDKSLSTGQVVGAAAAAAGLGAIAAKVLGDDDDNKKKSPSAEKDDPRKKYDLAKKEFETAKENWKSAEKAHDKEAALFKKLKEPSKKQLSRWTAAQKERDDAKSQYDKAVSVWQKAKEKWEKAKSK